MIKPLSKFELDLAKKEKDRFYRQIDKVVLPDWLIKLYPSCRVFIGGCIERGVGSSFRRKAHAHNDKKDGNLGCLCFRTIRRMGDYHTIANNNGTLIVIIDKPSRLVLHEFAHLLALQQGHNPTFNRRYRELLKISHQDGQG